MSTRNTDTSSHYHNAGRIGAMLIAALLSFPVHSGGFFVGGGVGAAMYSGFNELCRDITGALPGQEVPTDCDTDETVPAFKIFGGWRFNPYVALEAGYADLGDADDEAVIFDQRVGAEVSVTAIYADIIGAVPLGRRARVIGKIGIARVDGELTLDNPIAVPLGGGNSISNDATEAMYGVGFEYEINPLVVARVEWERFDFEDGIDYLSVSLIYQN